MLARHVSDLTGPSSGAFYKLYSQIWYVVIRVLLDTSSRYEVLLNRNIFQRALLQTLAIYSLYSGLQCSVLNNDFFYSYYTCFRILSLLIIYTLFVGDSSTVALLLILVWSLVQFLIRFLLRCTPDVGTFSAVQGAECPSLIYVT
jgi:hypothetical protein